MFHHYIDVIPFMLATGVVLFGPSKLSRENPVTALMILTAGVYMVAQSAWFSSWLAGNVWGRDFSNYVWFLFNTLTMVVFSWTLIKSD